MSQENGQLPLPFVGESRKHSLCRSEDHFFMKVANFQIDFTIQNDKAASLVVHEEGRDTPATRR